MANLSSPGVSVTYTDDTAYSTGTSSSIPLIILGTHKNKTTPSGAIAQGTLPENANTLYPISSQAELVSNFGLPVFYSSDGTPEHAYELNEQGLLCAYQFMGLNNKCIVLNSLIDYSQLAPLANSPKGAPTNSTYWIDTTNTNFGIFISNGAAGKVKPWTSVSPTIITSNSQSNSVIMGRNGFSDKDTAFTSSATNLSINGVIVNLTTGMSLTDISSAINTTKITGVSSQVVYVAGKYYLLITQVSSSTDLEINVTGTTQSIAISLGLFDPSGNPYPSVIQPLNSDGKNGDIAVNMTTNSNMVFQKIQSVIENDSNSANSSILWYAVGSDLWKIATQTKNTLYMGNYNNLPQNSVVGDIWISNITKANGMNFSIKIYSSTSGAWTLNNVAYYESVDKLPSTITDGQLAVVYGSVSGVGSYTPYISNNGTWTELVYKASNTTPFSDPSDGTYWYNNINFIVDIMINKNGDEWVGYKNYSTDYSGINPLGVIISGSLPTQQSDGTPLVDNDIWLDSSDQENYPALYRYSSVTSAWTQIDNTDDYSPEGIIFKDARQDDGSGQTTPASLLVSNNLDPDAPNPELYPDGMLLFNTRISTNNVKVWKENYFNAGGWDNTNYMQNTYTVGITTFPKLTSAGRWVSVSGNQENGSPYMGRKAQRNIIVESLRQAISTCENLYSEETDFSLIVAPGYIELLSDMQAISINRRNTAFVIGDTPARLSPNTKDLTAFANPSSDNLYDSETGIVTSSSLVGVYYPWGLSTNTDGTEVMIPPSTIALRTIAYSDSISYPWMAPAGYTRGIVSNATSVGYLDSKTNTFKSVKLDSGQRDTLYTNNINPIAYMRGQGLVIWGQKTRQGTTTALDRINTQRTLCLMITQLEALAKPFLFQNNTEHTRALVSTTFTKYMANLITSGAITDAVVVCDDTNNTSDTIAAHELFIDIAYIPVDSIEFIYIPIRLVNPGTDLATVYSSSTNSTITS